MLGDHTTHGNAQNGGFPDPQPIHGFGLIVGHVTGGVALRQSFLPAEHVDRMLLGELTIHRDRVCHRELCRLGADVLRQVRRG